MWIISAFNLYELAQICNKSWGSYPKTASVCVLIGKGLVSSKDALTLGLQTAYRTTQNWPFFHQFLVVKSKNFTNLCTCSLKSPWREIIITQRVLFSSYGIFFPPKCYWTNLCPSVAPTAANMKTERKCCQCSEWMRDDHPIKTVENNNMQWWLGTIIIHIKLFHISVPSYDALFWK
jgi:hypothetical protein